MTPKTTISRVATKLTSLINAAIELPGALHACVEMAREAQSVREELGRANEALSRGNDAFIRNLEEISTVSDMEIARLQSELNREREASSVERFISDERWAWARERIERLQDALSDCEMVRAMEKNRRIEHGLRLARIRDTELIRRYHRTVEMGGECYGTEPPSGVDVLFRDCSGDKPGPWQFGAVPTYGKFEWRYLSPEDMPDNQ